MKSWFGISMPTALLPGIGASIRRLRAARAIARSSARASIRRDLDVDRGLDLVLGHDRAGVAADDLGGDPEARELPDDDLLVALVDGLAAAGLDRGGDVLEQLERRQAVLDPLLRRRRVAGVGDVVERPDRSRRIGDQRRARRRALRRSCPGRTSPRSGACWEPPPGSSTRRRPRRPRSRSGRATTSCPRRPSRRPRRRPRRPSCRCRCRCRSWPASSGPVRPPPARAASRPRPRRRPSSRSRVTGLTSWRRRRLNASISPTMPIASSTTNAPGLVSSGSRMPASNRPIRPPPRSAPTSVRSRTSNAPRKPTYAIPIPSERHAPAGAGPLAGTPLDVPAGAEQEERQEPAAGLEPRRDRVAPPVGQRALAGQRERDQRDRAEHEQDDPDERAGDVGVDVGSPMPAGGAGAASSSRRRVAIRPRPRPGRPSAGASSARTGSATRRP